jgi:hypothetical protein
LLPLFFLRSVYAFAIIDSPPYFATPSFDAISLSMRHDYAIMLPPCRFHFRWLYCRCHTPLITPPHFIIFIAAFIFSFDISTPLRARPRAAFTRRRLRCRFRYFAMLLRHVAFRCHYY